MSNGIQTLSLLEAIRVYVFAAWSTPQGRVFFGQPRTTAQVPYAVIEPGPVNISFDGLEGTLTQVDQDNTFLIIGRFPVPTDPTDLIVTEQVTRANQLIAQLQGLGDFEIPAHDMPSGNPEVPPIHIPAQVVGIMPLVTGVDFTPDGPIPENTFEVSLSFQVLTSADHH